MKILIAIDGSSARRYRLHQAAVVPGPADAAATGDDERVDRPGDVAQRALRRDPQSAAGPERLAVAADDAVRVTAGGQALGRLEDLERTCDVE